MGEMDTPTEAMPNPDPRLLRRRDPRAVEAWFLACADPLYTFVFYRVGRDEDLAVEVVQETFVTALDKIADYDPRRGAMMAWLTYLARNRIRAARRRRARAGTVGDAWEEIDRKLLAAYRELATVPLPDEVLEKRETAELVRMALANLPDDYRATLKQRYYQQQSLAEIARDRATTESAVKSLLHRARLAFKTAFQTIAESLEDPSSTREVTP
jgi:RNA polymerase sigma-70 factor (ECF subfamily)